jgi:hypothetical protein
VAQLFAEGELSDRDLNSLTALYSAAGNALQAVNLMERIAALEARLGAAPEPA